MGERAADPVQVVGDRCAQLRTSSAMLAEAVVRAAVADGVAVFNPTNPTQAIQDAMWRSAYPDIRQNLPW